MQIKIADTQFAHGTSLGSGDLKIYPKHFEWYRGQDNINDIVVITESMFHKVDEFTEKIKIAWLLEPMSISPESYNWIKSNWDMFDFILSHNLDFIKSLQEIKNTNINTPLPILNKTSFRVPDIIWYPFGGCWIMPQDRKIYPKTKGISIIASGKTETEGHRLRHDVIKALGDKVDVYGRGYNPVEYKLDALKDYQYSIVIENERTEGFFTEKIIDCFVTGTIPIYWGDPTLGKEFFNQIKYLGPFINFTYFQTIQYLYDFVHLVNNNRVNTLPKDKNVTDITQSVLQFNMERAEQFTCPEDWLYNNFFMKEEVLKNQLIKFNIL
jgi:hypothetical protein